MKVFLVIPTLKQGGAERVMSELANEFMNQQHEVHLVLLAKSDIFYRINSNVQVHCLGFENKGRIKKLKSEIKTFFLLRKFLKRKKPDAVLSFMEKYNVFTILASRFLGLKVFVSDRSNPKKLIPSHITYMRNLLYKYADGVIAQTNLAKEVLERSIQNVNIKVIPNPVRDIQQYPLVEKERIIINVGRLVPEKGQKFLIEAFSLLEDQSWTLVILGEGPLRQQLENQIQTLGLRSRIFMPGSVTNVDEWLAKSSVFVFPSVSEGFPNALVEAMAAGLPCVSFDCDAGPRDIIIDDTNGFLIPVKNVDLMFLKMKELLNNPALRERIGIEAKKIKIKLDKKTIASEYLDFLQNKT